MAKEKIKKVDEKPKAKETEEIKHIVRILNADLDGKKQVQMALTGIKGVGRRVALIFAAKADVSPHAILGKLSDEQIDALKNIIERKANESMPIWMVNNRGDLNTGANMHIMGTDLAMSVREDIDIMKKTRSYKGIRHERGLRVRGQRTRSTGRTGAIVGVSRKREGAPAATPTKTE
jgi:small subunit ribosomal protein S13